MKNPTRQCIANFLIGVGSIFSLPVVFSINSQVVHDDAFQQMRNDVQQLGKDMKKGMPKVAHAHGR